MPRCLELELPEDLIERLQRSAERSDRSFNELVVALLDRGLAEHRP